MVRSFVRSRAILASAAVVVLAMAAVAFVLVAGGSDSGGTETSTPSAVQFRGIEISVPAGWDVVEKRPVDDPCPVAKTPTLYVDVHFSGPCDPTGFPAASATIIPLDPSLDLKGHPESDVAGLHRVVYVDEPDRVGVAFPDQHVYVFVTGGLSPTVPRFILDAIHAE